jgi:hypothetical protein
MVSEQEKLADCQEHNIPSWKSLAKIEIIAVLRFSATEQTQKKNETQRKPQHHPGKINIPDEG